MEVFSWQLLETVQLSILLFSCTAQSQNIVVFTITSKNREYKHKWLWSIKEQQIKYICKMFLFLIIAGAIYNTDFISYVGVCNDLLFWHILFKKHIHQSLLIKYSTGVKSMRRGSIHGTDAVTGKQTIPISSVLMFSQAQNKYTQRHRWNSLSIYYDQFSAQATDTFGESPVTGKKFSGHGAIGSTWSVQRKNLFTGTQIIQNSQGHNLQLI